MKITVETGSWAKAFVGESLLALDVAEGATVADVIKVIGLPEDEAGLAVLSGRGVSREHVLCNGDALKIHPVIIGG